MGNSDLWYMVERVILKNSYLIHINDTTVLTKYNTIEVLKTSRDISIYEYILAMGSLYRYYGCS